jgi:hypothetical protein
MTSTTDLGTSNFINKFRIIVSALISSVVLVGTNQNLVGIPGTASIFKLMWGAKTECNTSLALILNKTGSPFGITTTGEVKSSKAFLSL